MRRASSALDWFKLMRVMSHSALVKSGPIRADQSSSARSAFDARRGARWGTSAVHRAAAVAAERADIPLEFEQMVAARAGAAQLGAARWAELEVALDAIVAGWAGLALGHLRQQRLLFQLALVQLGQRLARAHDQVDEEAADVEDSDEQGGRDLQDDILRARADIAPGPEDERDPEDRQEGEEEERSDTNQPGELANARRCRAQRYTRWLQRRPHAIPLSQPRYRVAVMRIVERPGACGFPCRRRSRRVRQRAARVCLRLSSRWNETVGYSIAGRSEGRNTAVTCSIDPPANPSSRSITAQCGPSAGGNRGDNPADEQAMACVGSAWASFRTPGASLRAPGDPAPRHTNAPPMA